MISILLPIYNGEEYLRECIDSILNQTCDEFELLIGFNGVTDSSKEIVAGYSDGRIRVFNYDFKGKSKTLNCLLNETTYHIICLIDADDVWLPEKLEKQIIYIDNYDVIGTQMFYINSNSQKTNNEPELSCLDSEIKFRMKNGLCEIANLSAMINKKSLQLVKGWDENLSLLEDFDIWLRLINAGALFTNLNEKLVMHRIHTKSNFNTNTNQREQLIKILQKNG